MMTGGQGEPGSTAEPKQSTESVHSESKVGRDLVAEQNQSDSSEQPRGATEKVRSRKIHAAWGTLPTYVLKHARGSMPTVPEKYRKYLEALSRVGDGKSDK